MIQSLSTALIVLASLFLAGPVMAQISIARTPTGTAPVIGTVVQGSSATTFSISTAGVVTRSTGNAIRLSSSAVTAPTITITCGLNILCSSRDIRVTIVAAGASDDASITRFRVGALTGATYRTTAPAEAASLTFDLRPIGMNRSASFPLGLDVLLTAGADSGTDTYTFTVTAALR